MKNHYIYLITNNINNKKYIGKRSCNGPIEEDSYMGSGKLLKKAFKKYGINNFTKSIILTCDSEEQAYQEEKRIIKLTNAILSDEYYNLASGGRGSNYTKENFKKKEKFIQNELSMFKILLERNKDYINMLKEKDTVIICFGEIKEIIGFKNNFTKPIYKTFTGFYEYIDYEEIQKEFIYEIKNNFSLVRNKIIFAKINNKILYKNNLI